jgi:hypothetical protein
MNATMHSTAATMNATNKAKPLPLKQRTSSVDGRRDFSIDTWMSLLELLKLREYIVTVDHFSIWRRHISWAMESGKALREYMTQRYAASMVFMSLLLSAELSVLFNSAGVTTQVRQALMEERHTSVSFWAGIAIILSAVLTLLSLISTFTAWTMVSAVSDANAHCIFRSSIGQYAAELPGRFIVGSIYSFLTWLILFFFLLLPVGIWSILLMIIGLGLFVHVIATFSAFGRVIMHTGAMGSQAIFEPDYESRLPPHKLHANLLVKARANLANSTSIRRQYRSISRPIDRILSQDELSDHLSASNEHGDRVRPPPLDIPNNEHTAAAAPLANRKRTESLVKFADGFDTQGDPIITTPREVIIAGSKTTPMSALSSVSSAPGSPRRQHHLPPSRAAAAAKRAAAIETKALFVPNKPSSTDSNGGFAVNQWLHASSSDNGGRFNNKNPLPPGIPNTLSYSVTSSLDGTGSLGDTEFERLFDPELSASDADDDNDNHAIGGVAALSPFVERDGTTKTAATTGDAERTSLLKNDSMERGTNYSSFRPSKPDK